MVVIEENVSFFKKRTLKYGGWMTLFLTPHKEKEIERCGKILMIAEFESEVSKQQPIACFHMA